MPLLPLRELPGEGQARAAQVSLDGVHGDLEGNGHVLLLHLLEAAEHQHLPLGQGEQLNGASQPLEGLRGLGGPLLAPSSYFMKSPPVQYRDVVAVENLEAFIAGDDRTAADQMEFLAG